MALGEQRIAELRDDFVVGRAQCPRRAQFLLGASGVAGAQTCRAERDACGQMVRMVDDGALKLEDGRGDIALIEAGEAGFVSVVSRALGR